MACGSSDGAVQVYDASTGLEFVRALGAVGPVRAVAWSPDGRRIATSSADCALRVVDVLSGRTVMEAVHRGRVESFAWSP